MDEIKSYLDACYVGASEAMWRILSFKIHDGSPSIQRLHIHLPGETTVTFNETENVREVVDRGARTRTTLTEWFVANRNITGANHVRCNII